MTSNYTIWPCDCRTAMSLMDADSVDSIVCDPPYGLSKEPDVAEVMRHWLAGDDYEHSGSGFMGKSWDSFVPGPSVWREAYRVLKPGGHLVAFFGTRTYDLGVMALRLAGFEVRDQLAWVFGCLDEETEAVTSDGVKPYHKIVAGDLVLCYDAATGGYSYQPVQEVVVYDYEDTAYRLIGDFGEQVVSRNHRCIVERDGRETFVYAESLQPQERVPVLESLPALREALRDGQPLAESAEPVLRPTVSEADRSDGSAVIGTQNDEAELRDVRGGVLQTGCLGEKEQATLLQHGLQRSGSRDGVGEARLQRAGGMVGQVRDGDYRADDWCEQPGLERRRDVSQPQGQLREPADQVCSLSEGTDGDGPQGRLCDGTSAEGSKGDRTGINAHRNGASYQSPRDGQRSSKSDAVCDQSGPQEIRGWGGHKTSMVRVVPFQKRGKVWCLRVPTGAFVAVRGGVAFPTGNSGFPKSHDVSKAITAHERHGGSAPRNLRQARMGDDYEPTGQEDYRKGRAFGGDIKRDERETELTENALQWQGWGTALKPAYEPIVLCRKPLSERTVAANVLRWGTGAVNVDGCRVETTDGYSENRVTQGGDHFSIDSGAKTRGTTFEPSPCGRWPANLAHDGSDEATADMGDAQRYFYCAKASKADRNRGLEDQPEQPSAASEFRPNHAAGAAAGENGNPYGRWKPQRNNHSTVKPSALMCWLVRLITPPGGTVLDPFMGSGSTGVACAREGFSFIGCEFTEEYVPIAEARISFEYAENVKA